MFSNDTNAYVYTWTKIDQKKKIRMDLHCKKVPYIISIYILFNIFIN